MIPFLGGCRNEGGTKVLWVLGQCWRNLPWARTQTVCKFIRNLVAYQWEFLRTEQGLGVFHKLLITASLLINIIII